MAPLIRRYELWAVSPAPVELEASGAKRCLKHLFDELRGRWQRFHLFQLRDGLRQHPPHLVFEAAHPVCRAARALKYGLLRASFFSRTRFSCSGRSDCRTCVSKRWPLRVFNLACSMARGTHIPCTEITPILLLYIYSLYKHTCRQARRGGNFRGKTARAAPGSPTSCTQTSLL